jgi:hypothetical protein
MTETLRLSELINNSLELQLFFSTSEVFSSEQITEYCNVVDGLLHCLSSSPDLKASLDSSLEVLLTRFLVGHEVLLEKLKNELSQVEEAQKELRVKSKVIHSYLGNVPKIFAKSKAKKG